MCKKVIMTSMVMICCVSLNSLAKGAEAPKIISWSNSKTADSKTVFAVKPGEKITFSVKAQGAEEYRWWVDKEAQEQVKGESFRWTVPDKKGMWKILLKTTNKTRRQWVQKQVVFWDKWVKVTKDRRGKSNPEKKQAFIQGMTDIELYPVTGQTEWIVSTTMTRVKPGESIQKAIDSIRPEGGIVYLLPGVHDVRNTIIINKNNITVYGTHNSEVRAHDPKKDVFVIPHENPGAKDPWDRKPVLENFTFKGFKVTSAFGKTRVRKALIHAWNVRNLTVDGILNTSHIYGLVWVNVTGSGSKARSKNIVVKNNTIENSEVQFSFTEDIRVLNNTFKGPSSFIFIDRTNRNVHIIGNNLDKRGGGYACIVMDSTFYYDVRNNVCMGGRYGLRLGAGPKHIVVTNNTITEGSRGGIVIADQYGATGTIRNNRIYNSKGDGIQAHEYHWSKDTNRFGDISVIDNIIYNNSGDGIKVLTGIRLDIRENIIAGNQGYGISHTGTGKRTCKISLSRNNVWNNKAGKYNGVAPGAGDFSKDPLFANPSKGDFRQK